MLIRAIWYTDITHSNDNKHKVRPKYIFVYREDKGSSSRSGGGAGATEGGAAAGGLGSRIVAPILAACRRHSFVLSMLFYISILGVVALFQNRKFKRWYQKKFGASSN